MFSELSKQWKAQQGNVSGGVYWPGGGVTFNNGRWRPVNSSDPSSKTDSSKTNPSTPNSASTEPTLPLDVVSTDGFYLLYADVPGLAKSDLSIKLSNPTKEPRMLKISGQRSAPEQEGVMQQRRQFGPFATAWELPADAESEGISAKVSEGVLTVTVPKKQPQPEAEQEDDSQEIFIA